MPVQQLFCCIIITIIYHRTIVTGQDNQCIFRQPQFVERFHNLAYRPIKLYNSISAYTHRVLSTEAVVRETRNMNVIGCKIHKERLIFMLFDEVNGMSSNRIGNIFIFPKSFTTAFHETDTTDTIHNRHIVSVTRFLIIEQLGMISTGRLTRKILFITNLYRSRRIIICHFTVFYEYTRNTVGCCCHDIMIIKP